MTDTPMPPIDIAAVKAARRAFHAWKGDEGAKNEDRLFHAIKAYEAVRPHPTPDRVPQDVVERVARSLCRFHRNSPENVAWPMHKEEAQVAIAAMGDGPVGINGAAESEMGLIPASPANHVQGEISDSLHNKLVGLISKTLPCDSYTAATVVTVIKPYLRTTEPVSSAPDHCEGMLDMVTRPDQPVELARFAVCRRCDMFAKYCPCPEGEKDVASEMTPKQEPVQSDEVAQFWKDEYKSLARAGVERLAEYGVQVDPAEKMIEAAEYREKKYLERLPKRESGDPRIAHSLTYLHNMLDRRLSHEDESEAAWCDDLLEHVKALQERLIPRRG